MPVNERNFNSRCPLDPDLELNRSSVRGQSLGDIVDIVYKKATSSQALYVDPIASQPEMCTRAGLGTRAYISAQLN